jgi:hypothetical protein
MSDIRLERKAGNDSGEWHAFSEQWSAAPGATQPSANISVDDGARAPIAKTRKTSLTCLAEIAKCAVNSAVVDPMRAVAQIGDNSNHTTYDQQIRKTWSARAS